MKMEIQRLLDFKEKLKEQRDYEKNEHCQFNVAKWVEINWICQSKIYTEKDTMIVKINDEEMIPQEFKKEKVEIVIDKKAIKEKISNGEDIAGCEIVYSHSLVITPK